MPQPTPYTRQANFVDYETANPTSPKPGTSLDAEFNAVKTTLDGTLTNLALIQRDDGALKNQSVGNDQLKPEVTSGISATVDAAAQPHVDAAAASATAAANSASAAATSATNAGASEAAAASSAATAVTKASEAGVSKAAAATSEANAAASASAAAGFATSAAGQATAAAASETAAAASASVASAAADGIGNRLIATSSTSVTIGTGGKAWTVQAGKAFVIGMPLLVYKTSQVTTYMSGLCTGYNSNTGALSILVDDGGVGGSGTHTDWTVVIAGKNGAKGAMGDTGAMGPQGPQGPQGVQGPQGNQGTQGLQGDTGPAGADGATWHDGSGAPNAGLGVNGDYYLDDTTGSVYNKAAGAWSVVASIKGPQGNTGPTGATGSGSNVNTSKNNGAPVLADQIDFTDSTSVSWTVADAGAGRVTVAAAAAGGGLTDFVEAKNTIAPNNTIPVDSLSASGAETNIDVAVVPKGNGNFALAVADSTSTGGNKRGSKAVDLQISRFNATQVASGSNSFVAGSGSAASGSTSIAIGNANTASGANSAAIGGQSNVADAASSTAIGDTNKTNGKLVSFARGRRSLCRAEGADTKGAGVFAADGDAQREVYVYRIQTSDATVTELLSLGFYRLALPDDSTFAFNVFIVARRSDVDNESAAYELKGCIDRNAGAATTSLVGTVTKTVIAEDTAAWDVNAVADTANGALKITVTGEAGKTIRWVARVELVEVTG